MTAKPRGLDYVKIFNENENMLSILRVLQYQ
jgi:hypothetical protein